MIFSPEIRKHIRNKYGGRCAYCGNELEQFQIDHAHPKSRGGGDEYENLNPSCRQCNNFKSVYTIEGFRYELSKQVERARKYSVNFRNAERFGMIEVKDEPIVFYFETITPKA